MRTASIQRKTTETNVQLDLNLDGQGNSQIATGVGFFDHMLTLFARHGCFDLNIKANGDLHVDQHHTVEDVGICLGKAFREALSDKAGIRRYGHSTVPMDESLATVAVDFGGRAFLVFNAEFSTEKIGDFDCQLVQEFWQAFTGNALCNLHVQLHHGANSHHIAEAIYKCAARAIRMATEFDTRMSGVPSTKGTLNE